MSKTIDNKPFHETEARILQSAEREFMTKGFTGARTTVIAEAAGVTHAMLHYYFRTKEKLFDKIISDKLNMLKVALAQPTENADNSLDGMIRGIIDRHLDFLAANPDLPRFLIGELYNDSERSEKIIQKIKVYASALVGRLQPVLDKAAADGVCRKTDARQLMLDIVSLNVFSYMAAPAANVVLGGCMDNMDEFLELRKRENYDTVMRKLKP